MVKKLLNLLFVSSFVILVGCPESQQKQTSGKKLTNRQIYNNSDANTREVMRRSGQGPGTRAFDMPPDLNKTATGATNPPDYCEDCHLDRGENAGTADGKSRGASWERFSAESSYRRKVHTGPYGSVEWYNKSDLSLPGGPGVTKVKGRATHLSKKILDIIPLMSMAHKVNNQAMRVSSTTGGTHSKNSHHYKGNAIDIDPPAKDKVKIAKQIRENLKSSPGGGCGYFVYVEHSHIHVSYKGSGYKACPGYSVQK